MKRYMEFQEYDLVKTLVEKEGHPKGSKECIVSFYSDGLACEVEIWNKSNYPIDVVTYELNEIELIEHNKSLN